MMSAMTDRYAGFVVTLEENIREDAAEEILTALRMVKGVLSVEPVTDTFEVQMGKSRALSEFRSALLDLYRELDKRFD